MIDKRWKVLMVSIVLAGCATAGPPVGDDVFMVPEGTEMTAALDQRISPDIEQGEEIRAYLTEPVTNAGREVLPEGTELRGRVTAVQHAGSDGSEADVVKLNFDQVEVDGDVYPVRTTITEVNPDDRSDTEAEDVAAAVGAGAIAGAALGRIIGDDDESTLIGAAVGAAAGTAIVLGTAEEQTVLPEGSRVQLRLDTPLRVRG